MPERIAVIGASGFVGSTLVEWLLERGDYAVTAFAHSTGGAAALAHRGLVFERLDVLDRKAVVQALQDFDYVVNCTRGGKDVMLRGLDNLLKAAATASLGKFVHLSSVAVYGDPPHPDSWSEDAPTWPEPGSYGAMKLQQDGKVRHAAAKGLRAIILCPPNIIGPHSDYLLDIIDSIESGGFRLLQGTADVLNVVDVGNLCHYILSAIASDIIDARRLFVSDPARITWRDLCVELQPLLRMDGPIATLAIDAFESGAPGRRQVRTRSGGVFRHLLSDEVRSAIRLHPTWAAMEARAKAGVRLLGKRTEDYLRDSLVDPIRVQVTWPGDNLDRDLIRQQLRTVKHSPARCHEMLQCQPPLSFQDSMRGFREWYAAFFDTESPEWRLLGRARIS